MLIVFENSSAVLRLLCNIDENSLPEGSTQTSWNCQMAEQVVFDILEVFTFLYYERRF
jgi:hypothetical protein